MLIEEIKQFFHGDVVGDEKSLSDFSHDYSIFQIKPQVVVFPRDVADIKQLVAFVNKHKASGEYVSLTGRSAGTDMTGGPLNDSIIVEFTKYFNHIKEIGTNYARVEPGVYFRDFEKALNEKDLLYPPYPASKDLCALGGMIANNSGGEKTLLYGKTENYVEELKVVLSDGNEYEFKALGRPELGDKMRLNTFEGDIYRNIFKLIEENYDVIQAAKPNVSKNSAGYFLWNVWNKNTFDLTKLFVGSQGTLGLVTEAKLRLVPKKKYSRLAVVFLKDLTPLADLIVEILKYKPESLESYDDKTLSVALRFLPQLIASMKGNFLKLIWQFLPEVGMVLRGGLPKMVLLIELTSDDENDLNERLRAVSNDLKKFKVQIRILESEAEAEKYWTIRRQSFALLHSHSQNKETAPFIDDIIVRPEFLPEFLPKLDAILAPYKKQMIYTIAGHPGNGNFHIIPLMDLKDPKIRELIPLISEKVYNLVLEYKGSITAEHNDGLIRSPYLKKMYGEQIYSFFEETKKIFDPKNIFNPGKKVGSDLRYGLEHIKVQ